MPTPPSLTGKTILITGAAKRLGRAMALALAGEGAHIVVHYNASPTEAEALAQELRALGVKAWTAQANLAEPQEADRLFNHVLEMSGPVDALINNASIFPKDRLEDVTPERLTMNMNMNAFSPFFLSRAFAQQDREGSIINLLDARLGDYDKEHVSYHLSKRMLHSFTRMMALEFAPKVRVNGVSPGLILPPHGEDHTYLEALADSNPLQNHGAPQDITNAVLYLLKSPFVTGQILNVDGGRHMLGGAYG